MSSSPESVNVDEIKKSFDIFLKTISNSTKYIQQIYDYENSIVNIVLQKYGRFVGQFEGEFTLISEILEKLNYHEKESWPNHRGLQYIFMIHNMKNIFSAFERAVKGFPESSLILSRAAFESIFYITYISCSKDDPYSVFTPKFKISNFITKQLKLTHWNDYSILSVFSHGNQLGIYNELQSLGHGKPVTIPYDFDEKATAASVNYIMFPLYFYTRFINRYLFTNPNTNIPQELKLKLREMLRLEEVSMSTNPNDHWKSMKRDIDYIFEVIEIAESGADWSKYIRQKGRNTRRNFIRLLKLRMAQIL